MVDSGLHEPRSQDATADPGVRGAAEKLDERALQKAALAVYYLPEVGTGGGPEDGPYPVPVPPSREDCYERATVAISAYLGALDLSEHPGKPATGQDPARAEQKGEA